MGGSQSTRIFTNLWVSMLHTAWGSSKQLFIHSSERKNHWDSNLAVFVFTFLQRDLLICWAHFTKTSWGSWQDTSGRSIIGTMQGMMICMEVILRLADRGQMWKPVKLVSSLLLMPLCISIKFKPSHLMADEALVRHYLVAKTWVQQRWHSWTLPSCCMLCCSINRWYTGLTSRRKRFTNGQNWSKLPITKT